MKSFFATGCQGGVQSKEHTQLIIICILGCFFFVESSFILFTVYALFHCLPTAQGKALGKPSGTRH